MIKPLGARLVVSPIAGERPAIAEGADLSLRELSGGTLTHCEGISDAKTLASCLAALRIVSLPPVGRVVQSGAVSMLGIGPSIWLMVSDAPYPATEAFSISLDMTAAWTRVRIAGRRARDLIANGCAVDIHPSRFPQNTCATAGFAGLRSIIWDTAGENEFVLFVGRSYALSLWHWLLDHAAGYGCREIGGEGASPKRNAPMS